MFTMPKENLIPEKPSVAKLKAEVEALKKVPQTSSIRETPDVERLNLLSKTSVPFASGSNRMSWIAAGIVICLLLGATVGYFMMKPTLNPPIDDSSVTIPTGPVQPQTVTMHGVIRPLEASMYMQGTHQLVGEDGKVLAILEPGDKIQDLTFLEGSEVDVEGTASKTVEGDMTVIKVEKVRF